MSPRVTDLSMVVVANAANLLVAGIFLARVKGLATVESGLGIAVVALALPAGAAAVLNRQAAREWWTVVLPSLLVLFCLVELVLDYLLKLEFRRTNLLWPYLALYYLALLAMIGYSFGVSKPAGLVTLGTYLLNLLATWYSYSQVGHG